MTSPQAALIIEASTKILGDGDLDAIARFFTPDFVAHGTEQDMQGGHEIVRRFASMLRKSFPDLQVDVEILVDSDDRVAWQRTLRGTHEHAFMGFPATGRALVWRDMATTRFEGGLIAEDWVITDMVERLLKARKG